MAAERAAWRAEVTPALDPDRLAFLDGTRAKTNMARTHGYAPRGERSVEVVPHRHWRTTTFVGGPRADGFVAPVVIAGAVNGGLFLAYVRRRSAPALRPGDVAVMGDLGSHKVAGVREAVERAGGRLLYLPPYSPDLKPFENTFSKVEGLPRAAAERTVAGPDRAVARRVPPGRVPELPPALRVRCYTPMKSVLVDGTRRGGSREIRQPPDRGRGFVGQPPSGPGRRPVGEQ